MQAADAVLELIPQHDGTGWRPWRAVGRAALPSMERLRAAVEARTPEQDRFAKEYTEAIAGLMAEMKGLRKRAGEEGEDADGEEETDEEP